MLRSRLERLCHAPCTTVHVIAPRPLAQDPAPLAPRVGNGGWQGFTLVHFSSQSEPLCHPLCHSLSLSVTLGLSRSLSVTLSILNPKYPIESLKRKVDQC